MMLTKLRSIHMLLIFGLWAAFCTTLAVENLHLPTDYSGAIVKEIMNFQTVTSELQTCLL